MATVSEDGRLEAIQLTTDLKPNVPRKTPTWTDRKDSMRIER